MRRTALIGAVVAALALTGTLTGCGSDTPAADNEPPSAEWDAAGIETANEVGAQIRAARPGVCKKMAFHDRVEYISVVQKNMKTELPLAVAECPVNDENTLELSVFADAEKRDRFVQGRSDFLCNLAQKRKIDLSGLRWVVADSWSAQFDMESEGRDIADALSAEGAEYKATGCDPDIPPDWDTAAVEKAEELAATLETAGLGCKKLKMEVRDELRIKVRYQDGLPAAAGTCSTATTGTVGIAVFDSNSISRDAWITTELNENYCAASQDALAIPGPDWAVFLVKPDAAVVKALAGEPPVGCSP